MKANEKKFSEETDSKKLAIIAALAGGLAVDVSFSGGEDWHPVQYIEGHLTIVVLDAYYRISKQHG